MARHLTDELEHKLQLKRLGGDEFKSESQQLLNQVNSQFRHLNAGNKEEKKKIATLKNDKAAPRPLICELSKRHLRAAQSDEAACVSLKCAVLRLSEKS
jgi:hypothetical protein